MTAAVVRLVPAAPGAAQMFCTVNGRPATIAEAEAINRALSPPGGYVSVMALAAVFPSGVTFRWPAPDLWN